MTFSIQLIKLEIKNAMKFFSYFIFAADQWAVGVDDEDAEFAAMNAMAEEEDEDDDKGDDIEGK